MEEHGTASTEAAIRERSDSSEFEVTPDSQIFEALSSEPNS